ncbi:hypothetical protein MTO96_010215 [Rhipicephalus appendiculatus]
MATDHVLELSGVHYTGPVSPPTCFQAFTWHRMLGSKGSGKKALLEVVARRAMGPTRGQILLNDVPLTLRLFQEQCGYVPRRCSLVPGVTVRQTLHFAAKLTVASKVSGSVKRGRVKQVMADLALNQVANKEVSSLSINEYRRLSIAVELVRDPVLVVLDEPTADLDPLNTYFVVSILANHAKKYNRLVLLTMSKPRSDIFPFLDRAAYLCLGRDGLHWLHTDNAGVLSQHRLSLSRAGEPTHVLPVPGHERRVPPSELGGNHASDAAQYKLPLTAYGQPSCWQTFWAIYGRLWASTFNCNGRAFGQLALRLVLMPVLFAVLLLFYFPLSGYQQSFLTRNGLFISCFMAATFGSAAITALTYAPHRTRYYQESREGKYRGPLFVFTHTLFSIPLSLISVFAGATIIYAGTGLRADWQRWATFCGVMWCLYALAEQQTVALMMVVRSSFASFRWSACILSLCAALASGTVRSLVVLPDWTYYLTYATLQRYAAAFVQQNELEMHPGLENLPSLNGSACGPNVDSGRCFFVNGSHYLGHKYRMGRGQAEVDVQYWLNFGLCFAFVGSFCLVNVISHIIPLPASIKSKFRD